jgi:adenylate kinase
VKPRIVLLGPPASGKGTVAAALSQKLGVPHVSTGALFREAISRGGVLGKEAKRFIDKGQLVPDDVVMGVVREWLDDKPDRAGFIFDGFPRTEVQAQRLDALLRERNEPLTAVLLLDATDDTILRRALGRLSCPKCGALYHVEFVPPETENACDKCGEKLERRADDNEKTVKKRIAVYAEQTQDAVDYYEKQGILRRVDANLAKEKLFQRVLSVLKSDKTS